MYKKIGKVLAILMVIPFMVILTSCKKEKKTPPQSYTLTYELGGGTNSSENPSSYTNETDEITLKPATRENYEFIGWYLDDSFSIEIMKIEKGSSGNKTLYARWMPTFFKIEYELNGGTNDSENLREYTVESNTFSLKSPSKLGYSFDGWYEEDTFDNIVSDIYKGSTGNKKFYAKWVPVNYIIEYEYNNGTPNELNPSSYTVESETITLESSEREGYTFDGWFLDEHFETKVTEIESGSMGNKKFYAKWTAKIYEVTYYLDDGENSENNPRYFTIESDTITLNNAQKSGFDFKGWFLDSSFETKVSEILKGTAKNITLYAYFEPSDFTIYFNYNGADENTELKSKVVKYNSSVGELPVPAKTNHEFMGWYYDDNILYTNETIFRAVNDIILVARWQENDIPIEKFDVQFNPMNGSVIDIYNDIEFGSKLIKPNDPVKLGYSFDGWYEDDSLWDFENNLVTKDTILSAKWSIVNYNITYHLDDGTNSLSNPLTYTILDSVTFDNPTKNGYSFRGWFTDEEFTNKIESIEVGTTGDVDIYAYWSIIETGAYSNISLKYNLPDCVSHLYSDYEVQVQIYSFFTLPSFDGRNINQYFQGFYYLDSNNVETRIRENVIEVTTVRDFEVYAKWDNEAIENYYYSELLEFSLNSDSTYAIVTSYNGIASTIVIPKLVTINGVDYQVLEISDYCFNNNSNIVSVIFNGEKISIGNYAFNNSSIRDFDFTKVEKIGDYAFSKSNINNAYFGNYLNSIGRYAFSESKIELVSFTKISEILSSIPDYCFANCIELSTIIPSSHINYIGYNAFDGCTSLTNIDFVMGFSTETMLGNYVFSNCSSFVTVTIPQNVIYIGNEIFNNCENLETLKMYRFFYRNEFDSFNAYFSGTKIANVEILGNHENTIPKNYFKNNDNLKSVIMSNNIISIGSSAFANCKNLENITLSNSLKLDSFSISVFNNTKWLNDLSEILVIETTVVYIPNIETLTDVVISEGAEYISSSAASNNRFIKSISIPSSLIKIGSNAFYSCENLESITFAENSNIEEIGNNAFYNCYKLSNIDLSNCTKLKVIGNQAFFRAGMRLNYEYDFIIPSSVETIGDLALAAINVDKFICNNDYFFADEKGILYEIDESGEKVSLISYPRTVEDFIFVLPSSVKKICPYAFAQNYELWYLYISSDVVIENNVSTNSDFIILSYNCDVELKDNNIENNTLTILDNSLYIFEDEDGVCDVNDITLDETVTDGYYLILENDSTYMLVVNKAYEEEDKYELSDVVDMTEIII